MVKSVRIVSVVTVNVVRASVSVMRVTRVMGMKLVTVEKVKIELVSVVVSVKVSNSNEVLVIT
jgi:hypothetical protein